MTEFAGFCLPIEYSGITREHLTVRTGVGLFDVSHMGQFLIDGENATNFLQHVSTNDVSGLTQGKAQYSCLPNGLGGVVDDLLIYRMENAYLLIVNASNIKKDWEFLRANLMNDTHLKNLSHTYSLLALQGPKASQVMQTLTTRNISLLKSFEFLHCNIGNINDVMISRTGYTGEDGFELMLPNEDAEALWKQIMQAGAKFDLQAIGLGARDTLRIEAGLCLYGNEIDDTTSTLEAGLGWISKLHKKEAFIDKQFLLSQEKNGVRKKLIRFILQDKGIPRKDYPITNYTGKVIGKVSSGTISPGLKKGIGMGYVPQQYAVDGKDIYIDVRGRGIKATITTKPFKKTDYGYM